MVYSVPRLVLPVGTAVCVCVCVRESAPGSYLSVLLCALLDHVHVHVVHQVGHLWHVLDHTLPLSRTLFSLGEGEREREREGERDREGDGA